MKTSKYIASFMYFLVLLVLIVYTTYFIIGQSAKIFGNNGQYIYRFNDNSWITIGSKNSEGSLVPVKLTLNILDSISINENYFGPVVKDSYPYIKNQFLKENKKVKAINIYDIRTMDVKNYATTIEEDGSYKTGKSSGFQFIKYVDGGDSQYLSIKTNNSFTNVVLALRSPLIILFHILEMFFLAMILKELAKEIYFSKVLSKLISKLGCLLLFSQLIPVIYAFIDTRLFGNITVIPQILKSLQNTYFENIKVSFNPTIDMSFYTILLGAVLVLLTKLIERGRSLEEENELTI